VGGAENSQHLVWATDVVPAKPGPGRIEELASAAEYEGFDGIGAYLEQGFVHLDLRGSDARWTV